MVEPEERPVADRIDGVPTPSQCRELTGHADAFDRLHQSFKSGRMHHAWLLNGPRGIGKASLATLFAKYMFSHGDASAAPERFDFADITDNVHRQVMQGGHPELLHLTRPWDEKAKRFKTQLSVEEVRRTLPFYGMTAGAGGWRITIVDAADDMNASAANALLKILEEPPKRSLFFVLSHSSGRLLTTIRSRCQQLNLTPLKQTEVVEVIDSLGVQASDDDKLRAAKLSEGSVRRAIQLIQSTVMSEYQVFEKMMASQATGGAADWVQVHKIADAVSRKGQEEAHRMLLDLVTGWIGTQVRENSNQPASALAGWAEVWDKANRSSTLADAFNLDKKQVILSLFGDLFEHNKTQ